MNIAYKLTKIADKILNTVIYVWIIVIFVFCLYALFDTFKLYFKSSSSNISAYKPDINDPITNLSLLKNINEDVCGWITVENTNIDYPVVIGESNSEYLSKDVYGNYSLSGSIFLDYRNSRDFTDLYSVIFGHHMTGGTMFSDITQYASTQFFNENKYGYLYSESGTVYKFEIFAYLQTDAYDSYIYSININDTSKQQELLDYVEDIAINYSDVTIDVQDKIIALSTCSTAITNGRDLILAVLRVYEN